MRDLRTATAAAHRFCLVVILAEVGLGLAHHGDFLVKQSVIERLIFDVGNCNYHQLVNQNLWDFKSLEVADEHRYLLLNLAVFGDRDSVRVHFLKHVCGDMDTLRTSESKEVKDVPLILSEELFAFPGRVPPFYMRFYVHNSA